jgi:cell division protein FtsZ
MPFTATQPTAASSGGYQAPQPSQSRVQQPLPFNNPVKQPVKPVAPQEEDTVFEMKLVIKEDAPEVPQQAQQPLVLNTLDDLPADEEVDDQKKRASERIQKLRNLSFNINGADTNSEFDNVPAYIRRNLELYNTVNNVESFYSSYTVKSDENNKSQISTINTFLEGKKPD